MVEFSRHRTLKYNSQIHQCDFAFTRQRLIPSIRDIECRLRLPVGSLLKRITLLLRGWEALLDLCLPPQPLKGLDQLLQLGPLVNIIDVNKADDPFFIDDKQCPLGRSV
jgi:hypothetical protein